MGFSEIFPVLPVETVALQLVSRMQVLDDGKRALGEALAPVFEKSRARPRPDLFGKTTLFFEVNDQPLNDLFTYPRGLVRDGIRLVEDRLEVLRVFDVQVAEFALRNDQHDALPPEDRRQLLRELRQRLAINRRVVEQENNRAVRVQAA